MGGFRSWVPYFMGEDWPGFSGDGFCVMLACMGNKDKGRKEAKKAPKPKPKPEPGRKREIFAQPAPPK